MIAIVATIWIDNLQIITTSTYIHTYNNNHNHAPLGHLAAIATSASPLPPISLSRSTPLSISKSTDAS